MKPRVKAKVNDLPNGRAQVLEALLDASLHLHRFRDAPEALQESFLSVSEIVNAHTMLLYRQQLPEQAGRVSKCVFGIALQDSEWLKVEEHRMPVLPSEPLQRCEPGHFSPVDTGQIGWRADQQFWSTAINEDACLLIGLNDPSQADTLMSLQPFVHALEGFLARTDAEEKVQTQRNYLRTIIDNMPGLVFAKDKQGRFVIANKKVAELYGVPIKELIGKTDADFHYNQQEVERYLKEDRKVIEEGKSLRLPNDHITTNHGQTLFLNTTKVPVPSSDGEAVHVLGIAQDITHQRQAEQRERMSRHQYKQFIHHTTEGIYNIKCKPPIPIHLSIEDQVDWFYASAYLADCNQALAAMYGFEKPEELIGKKVAELHGGSGSKQNRKVVTQFFKNGLRIQNLETFELRKDGSRAWFVNHSAGVLEEGLLTDIWGGQIDVTERKRMELSLRESKERTELILDAAKLGLWEWDPQNDTCYYNQYWGEMLGFSPEEVKPHRQSFEELIHPDDQAIVWQTLQKHLAGETSYFEAEIRLRTKSGGYKWIYDQGRMVGQDEQGRPKKVVGIHMDIHERKQAERALQESEALFRSLFEESPLAILFCSADGFIRQANHKAGVLLGSDQQELIGERLDDFSAGSSLLEDLHREGQSGSHSTSKIERQLARKDGGTIWANLLFSTLYGQDGQLDRIICSVEDISKRREAQEALAESKQLKQAILEALPDLKFRLDREGRFLDYYGAGYDNDNWLMPPNKVLGQKAKKVLPSYLSEALVKNINAAIAQKAVQTFEYPMMLETELRHYEARVNAVDTDSAIVVVREVTNLKRAQQDLRKKLEELDRNNEMLTRYVDSNAQLENFAHTVSHDLREPVRTMNSFSQLLQQKYADKLDEDAHSYLAFISQSAQHMNKLIEDLLEFARLTNSSDPEFEQVDLQELAGVVQHSIRGLITDKNAEVIISHPLPTIMGNRTKLGQLFQNLISNGIKFSRPGQKPRVDISSREEGDYWHFSIADNGIGIDEEHHRQIFQLFRRLHSKKVFPGSGIGLSLCKRVVEQHGGTIYVESKLGEGATFHFTLHKNY